MVFYKKGPTRHAYAWQIGPFWQNTLEVWIGTQLNLGYVDQGRLGQHIWATEVTIQTRCINIVKSIAFTNKFVYFRIPRSV